MLPDIAILFSLIVDTDWTDMVHLYMLSFSIISRFGYVWYIPLYPCIVLGDPSGILIIASPINHCQDRKKMGPSSVSNIFIFLFKGAFSSQIALESLLPVKCGTF